MLASSAYWTSRTAAGYKLADRKARPLFFLGGDIHFCRGAIDSSVEEVVGLKARMFPHNLDHRRLSHNSLPRNSLGLVLPDFRDMVDRLPE